MSKKPKYPIKYNAQKLGILIKLRKDAHLSQKQVAQFFGVRNYQTIGAWESGYWSPKQVKYRLEFIRYLKDKDMLMQPYDSVLNIWRIVMEDKHMWGWDPLSDGEKDSFFPGPVKNSIQVARNTIELSSPDGVQRRLLFLAPPYLSHKLVGRDDLLCDLKQRLFAGGSVALTALNGLPGVGKTTLALALAHDPEVLDHFQDGVLWVGLGRNGDVLSELRTWALALGISSAEVSEQTGLKESTRAISRAIGGRRMLLVADDIWSLEAALAFRLTGPNCAYIVTSRLREVALAIVSKPTTVEELN